MYTGDQDALRWGSGGRYGAARGKPGFALGFCVEKATRPFAVSIMIVFAFVLTPCVCAVRWICGRVPAWKGTGETSATSSTRSRRSSSPASRTPACLAQALHPARGPHPRRTSPEQLLPAPRLQPRLIGPVARLLERDMKATLAAIDVASVPYDGCCHGAPWLARRYRWNADSMPWATR